MTKATFLKTELLKISQMASCLIDVKKSLVNRILRKVLIAYLEHARGRQSRTVGQQNRGRFFTFLPSPPSNCGNQQNFSQFCLHRHNLLTSSWFIFHKPETYTAKRRDVLGWNLLVVGDVQPNPLLDRICIQYHPLPLVCRNQPIFTCYIMAVVTWQTCSCSGNKSWKNVWIPPEFAIHRWSI